MAAEFFEGRDFTLSIETRVQPGLCHASIFEGSFPRLVQCDDICATQTEVSSQRCALAVFLSFDCYAYNPAPCAKGIGNKIQTRTVAMPTRAEILYQFLC